ncbi:flagellin [Gemmobacter denitrificans]|uniref:Flagellin n=1 Tax=Gemmobacter denitrificans TaxID=3123040 RepID=A0ABU8BVC9_9RHOB
MSSILTNTSAMVALQTLKGITQNLEKTQSEISTGKSVANARDNAAVWAISKVMESDVQGFKGISDSLALGSSTVSVARSASETVTDLLTQMKGKIVASQESNVDRAKIQTDIVALRDQIGAVVGAAQFNGLNLLSNQSSTAGSQTVDILSSLDRSGSGVAVSEITVAKNDIGIKNAVDGATAGGGANTAIATLAAGATTTFMTVLPANVAYGTTYNIESMAGTAVAAANQVSYVTRNGDTAASVAAEMVNRLNFVAQREGRTVSFAVNATDATQIDITNTSTTTAVTGILATDIDRTTGGTAGGGLNLLQKFDVTTSAGANAALAGIEGLIQTSIKSAASFGSVQGRIDTQQKFVDSLTGSLKAGIGTLVDANMEETSARLQALQVQQQLGVQALSIANQSPQSILSLFR